MPQSLSRMLVHVVFSTKGRANYLPAEICETLHPYMAGALNSLKCPALQVGGTDDHVHALFGLSRTMAISEIVEKLKVSSSKWLKDEFPRIRHFAWQHGYGAFSIGYKEADSVIEYIRGQPEHHRKLTFQEEYRLLLKEHNVEFDERYIWD